MSEGIGRRGAEAVELFIEALPLQGAELVILFA
jgi:hypothetical protein